MNRKLAFILFGLLFSTGVFAQFDPTCGYKESCDCAGTVILDEAIEKANFAFKGTVVRIDTLGMADIITKASHKALISRKIPADSCALNILQQERVLRVKIKLTETIKGDFNNKSITILTPINSKFCAYNDFKIDNSFLVFATYNLTADIYFTWNPDYDFFELKSKNRFWTNFCQSTQELKSEILGQ